MTDVAARQRQAYDLLLRHDDGSFLTERPAYLFPSASSDPVASTAMCAHAQSRGGGNARQTSANEWTARCRASAR